VTTQRYLPNQNGIYNFAGGPAVAPNPNLFTQAFALVPGQDVIYPKAWVFSSFAQDDWRVRPNLTLNYGVRYDVELVRDIPGLARSDDKNNVDPRVGFNWDPLGDQRWSVHGGAGRFTQQNPIFTIVKGAVLGRNGIVTLALPPSDPAFPKFPNALPRSLRARCSRRATSRKSRRTWRTSSRGSTASACSGSSARARARPST
jgi:hypothetical protein